MLLSLFYGAIDRRVYKQVLNKEIRKKTILKETQDIHSKMKKKKTYILGLYGFEP